jgi:hypothetical protein
MIMRRLRHPAQPRRITQTPSRRSNAYWRLPY